MPAMGLRVKDVGMSARVNAQNLRLILTFLEHRLQQSDVKGFPIVSADHRSILLGYIGRNELRYILGPSPYHVFLYSVSLTLICDFR